MGIFYLAIAAGLFMLWAWGRSEMIRKGGWRMFAGLFSVVLAVVGIALIIRGEWFIGLPMVLGAVGSAAGGRINRASFRPASGPPPERERPSSGMSAAEARSILGVAPEASAADVRAAYKRLMQLAHPDKGGSVGLAAQLNAARDRLLKG